MMTPYILFDRQCEEAMLFYEQVFSGQNKKILKYNEYVPDGVEEDVSNYVLHGDMELFGTQVTFADEFSEPVVVGNNVHLTINPDGVDEATKMYDQLKEEGSILLPPTKTFYSPLHTSVKDKYGIVWNIIVVNIDGEN
ncbi:PhnB protein [Enterococcus sp. AZ135]|uniref:VOC family protein n=1 Tax=unclassified Enterococcus TaxID=2608891 RepID=UPI003F250FDA